MANIDAIDYDEFRDFFENWGWTFSHLIAILGSNSCILFESTGATRDRFGPSILNPLVWQPWNTLTELASAFILLLTSIEVWHRGSDPADSMALPQSMMPIDFFGMFWHFCLTFWTFLNAMQSLIGIHSFSYKDGFSLTANFIHFHFNFSSPWSVT